MLRLTIAPLFCTALWAAVPSLQIQVDQAGYLPQASKLAMVSGAPRAGAFALRRTSDDAEVFRGTLGEPLRDGDSGDTIRAADFTAYSREGRYYLDVAGQGRSWNFDIAKDVYRRAYYLAMRSFYGQRCGTAVDLGPEFPGYRHEACHLEGAYHPSSGKTGAHASKNGWHDAGDYGRYIVNSGITTGTLLWTWEFYGPGLRKISLKIPESGKRTPDLLAEVRWNLEWMLTMQDADGGVWQKQTSEQFCGFVMPEKDRLVSYVLGAGKEPFKSSCATGDFAAVMAIAARVYLPYDKAFAGQCRQAAIKAWAWLEQNPAVLFNNPAGVSTGTYGDRNCADEHLWAAAELFRTTREPTYHGYFLSHYEALRGNIRAVGPQNWGNVANLGLWSYALAKWGDEAARSAIVKDSLAAADEIVKRSARNGYRVSLVSRDYVWGSNGVVSNYGMQLLVADRFRPDPAYRAAALDNLHYLLGRNTHSLSFVTRVGENPFRHPHHRPSGADANAEPWPGLLSGGPIARGADPEMRKLPAGLPPAKSYLDAEGSYSSNENAINWNAPLVFLLAGALNER